MNDPYSQFTLDAFESLDVEGADSSKAGELKGALEREIVSRMTKLPGWEGFDAAVADLNRHGLRLERVDTDEGWLAVYQETNEGTRDFWIHATREDDWTRASIRQRTISPSSS